ncbi:ArsR/SmtB family transcription factor [Dellaglioa algida]|nr:metalloregulator ArsR/SmtB family transcription factor [Dellaglioa algida]MDK1728291.1 metalloregulator ArsR/SmtB family transcription factor [Dellaglioa algida]
MKIDIRRWLGMEAEELEPRQSEALQEFISNLDILNALADEKRQRLIILLGSRYQRELTVSELVDRMSLSQPAVSHHLKVLKDVGLIDFKQTGLKRFYFLTPDKTLNRLEHLIKMIREGEKLKED